MQLSGKDVWRSLRTSDLTTARKLAYKLASDLLIQDKLGIIQSRIKFKVFAMGDYSRHQATRVKHWHDHDRSFIERVALWFGDKTLETITVKDIHEALARLIRDGRKATTANNYLERLRHIFECAINWGYVMKNPAKQVEKFREQRRPEYVLQSDKEEPLFSALGSPVRLIAVFALHTGMRLSEILNLRIRDVDFSTSRALLRETKNGRPRYVDLNRVGVWTVQQAIHGRELEDDYVFVQPTGRKVDPSYVGDRWRAARQAVGLSDFRFHDLRHTFASRLESARVNPAAIMKLTGHESTDVYRRYVHTGAKDTKEAVKTLEEGSKWLPPQPSAPVH